MLLFSIQSLDKIKGPEGMTLSGHRHGKHAPDLLGWAETTTQNTLLSDLGQACESECHYSRPQKVAHWAVPWNHSKPQERARGRVKRGKYDLMLVCFLLHQPMAPPLTGPCNPGEALKWPKPNCDDESGLQISKVAYCLSGISLWMGFRCFILEWQTERLTFESQEISRSGSIKSEKCLNM